MWSANLKDHKFANRWRANICTNGTLLNRKDVRDFLEEFSGSLNLTISVDGCPEIQDLNRVFPNGEGTSSEILNQWEWYLDYCKRSHVYPSTKSTLSRNSIPYLYESLVYLHEELKLDHIYMNFIMENTHADDNDYKILDEQLEKCYNYMIKNPDFYWSFFDESNIGEPFTDQNKKTSRCGSGAMPTLGINGKIYPCFRWLPHSVESEEISNKFILGDVFNGLKNKQGFEEVRESSCWKMSDDECKNCEIQSACSYYSEFQEFKRTKYICNIAKLQSKWTKKYWESIGDKYESQNNKK